ncbi:MAG: heavy-metal-associated domain-containing protein [Tabrizicola sp.]|nr:heavy-metal-associated domain-containing protein [Tabrizicola sp.]
MKYHVPEMSCGHCKATVEKALAALDGAAAVTVDLTARTVEVQTARPADQVIGSLKAAGYEARLLPA